MAEPTHAKADIIPYTPEYSELVRSWIESEETLFNVCRGTEYPPSEELVDTWQRPEVQSFLLFAERHPVAYAELWPKPNDRAVEIAHLLVDPYQRMRGYGVTMLNLLFERATTRAGVARVNLNLYNTSEAALGCYLKAGFELVAAASHTLGLKMVKVVKR